MREMDRHERPQTLRSALPPGDAGALQRAVEQLPAQPERLDQIARAAKDRMRAFSPTMVVLQIKQGELRLTLDERQ
jgi:hypothetical protein